jgi:hypothetical protein
MGLVCDGHALRCAQGCATRRLSDLIGSIRRVRYRRFGELCYDAADGFDLNLISRS